MCGVGFLIAFALEKGFVGEHSHDHGPSDHIELKTIADYEDDEQSNEDEHEVHENRTSVDENDQVIEQNADNVTTEGILRTTDFEREPINEGSNEGKVEFKKHLIHENKDTHSHSHASKRKPKKTHSHSHSEAQPKPNNQNKKQTHPTSVYLLAAVFALETCISGSALGIATNTAQVIAVFVAIVSHIWAEGFALSAACLKNQFSEKKIYIIVFLWILCTPIGIGVGWGLRNYLEGDAATLTTSVLVAGAAGGL